MEFFYKNDHSVCEISRTVVDSIILSSDSDFDSPEFSICLVVLRGVIQEHVFGNVSVSQSPLGTFPVDIQIIYQGLCGV
jgi:hypothetical protein